MGGLSSCIILLGISLLYINTGSTSLENIYMINSISNTFANSILYENVDLHSIYTDIYTEYTYIQLPLAIMSVGFLFKIGLHLSIIEAQMFMMQFLQMSLHSLL